MSEPEEPRIACVGCGAMNPAGAEVCSGCGHRFGGPSVEPPSSGRSEPATPTVGHGTFTRRPNRVGDAIVTVAKILGGAMLVLLSSVIAFLATCFPTGLMVRGTYSLVVALVVGVVAALCVGGTVAYILGRGRRARNAKPRSGEDRL